MKKTINILLLGGARRVSMAEQLIRSGSRLGHEVNIFSYELSREVPIALVAEVIIGLRWTDPDVIADIARVCREKEISIVLPFVDGAIEVAARCKGELPDVFIPVVEPGLAEVMFDKIEAAKAFAEAELPIPYTYSVLNAEMPAIAKPRHGSASRGIKIFHNIDDLMRLENLHEYLVQQYIEHNREFTIDCYISQRGEVLVTVPRLRIEVMGGEVTRTRTVDSPELIEMSRRVIDHFGFRGPVTLQFLEDTDTGRFMLMEVNPRLGGGVICSIFAGAPITDYIIEESLGLNPKPCTDWLPALSWPAIRKRPSSSTKSKDMKHTLIIAEAGVNHNGNFEMARKMVHQAKLAGADYVKFQTAVPELVISTFAPKAEYQKQTTGEADSQLEMCKAIHLPLSDYARLKEICAEEGIGFMSTPFDLVSIRLLAELGQDYFKVPSGEITNLPYLREIAKAGRPVILSCGMSVIDEIEDAILILTGEHPRYRSESKLTRDDIIVLHCNTQYPTPYCDVNLRAMLEIRDRLGVRVGYSDHTQGTEVSVAAAALGAEVVEKHFTLPRFLPGPDHKASLEPDELREMVSQIRHIDEALGDGHKQVSRSEKGNMTVARKSIVAARPIAAGEIFSEENITVKRPGNGISPMRWDEVIGRPAPRAFLYDELVEL